MNENNDIKDSDSSRANSFIHGLKAIGIIKSSTRLIIFLFLTIITSIISLTTNTVIANIAIIATIPILNSDYFLY